MLCHYVGGIRSSAFLAILQVHACEMPVQLIITKDKINLGTSKLYPIDKDFYKLLALPASEK